MGGTSGSAAVVAILAAAVVLAAHGVEGDESWRYGRATFYGNEPWLWTIHEGSCGYGYIWPDEPLGWDVAALPDSHYEYSGSCGGCYEVKCHPMSFQDKFGNKLQRNDVCYDSESSVVLRITDTCPCNYASNWFSNKRWCCGDMDHFDMSIWAFEKLADMKWGVIGLKYRPVNCNHQPSKPAPSIANPFRGEKPPAGATRPVRDWPDYVGTGTIEEQQAISMLYTHGSATVWESGVNSDWNERHWNSETHWSDTIGLDEGIALCGTIAPDGAVSFQGPQGKFKGKVSAEFWIKTDAGVPDIAIGVSGPKGHCSPVSIQELSESGNTWPYTRYDLYLPLTDRDPKDWEVTAFADAFSGCGGMGADEIDRISFRNLRPTAQQICLDRIKLVG